MWFLVIASLCVGVLAATPPVPIIPTQFYSTHATQVIPGTVTFTGAFYYDNGQTAMYATTVFEFGPHGPANFTSDTYVTPKGNFVVQNGVCRPLPGKGGNGWFTWVPGAKFDGTATIDGIATNRWVLSVPSRGIYLQLNVRQDDANVPVFLILDSAEHKIQYTFATFEAAAPPPSRLQIPSSCFEPPPICEVQGVSTVEMYRFHKPYDYSLADEDVADAAGDTAFVCTSLATGHAPDGYQWISVFEVEVNATWGQYVLYNQNVDPIGSNFDLVGREAAFGGIGTVPNNGQCSPDSDIGVWYSLSHQSQCADGASPSPGGCAWRTVRRIKTINATCVAPALLKACKVDGRLPFPSAVKTFLAAFSSTDPANGGCPSLDPPSSNSGPISASEAEERASSDPALKGLPPA